MRVRVESSALALGAAAKRSKMRLFRTHRPGKAATMANQANSLSHMKWMRKYRIVRIDGEYMLTDLGRTTLSTNPVLPQCAPENIL